MCPRMHCFGNFIFQYIFLIFRSLQYVQCVKWCASSITMNNVLCCADYEIHMLCVCLCGGVGVEYRVCGTGQAVYQRAS